ncbi:hypothetical protein AB0G04_23380 [Actinoplanes sp. NPDC023801]|uniref:hypothetical protein n=1 Tax=Actinoplanes sp. NPDC023801 TaxID=3154595 RepID=UPI0033C69EF1
MTDEWELRLRSALAARAGQVTQERLRFGVPPTVAVPREPSRLWRLWRWLPLPAGAAIVAVALTLTLGPRSPGPEPIQPADPVVTAPPSPSTTASPSSMATDPAPSTSAPRSVPATPSRSARTKGVTVGPGAGPVTKPARPEATPAG